MTPPKNTPAKTKPPKPKRKGSGNKPGRPEALTPEVADAVVAAVREGASIPDAATLAGVTARTLGRWTNEYPKTKTGKQKAYYSAFARRVTLARAQAKHEAIRGIAEAARDRFVFPTDDELVAMGIDPDDDSLEGKLHRRIAVRPKFIPGDWKARKFWLQTRYPSEFAEPGKRPDADQDDEAASLIQIPPGATVADLLALAYGPGHTGKVAGPGSSWTVEQDPDDDGQPVEPKPPPALPGPSG